jgi:hypothetical protein
MERDIAEIIWAKWPSLWSIATKKALTANQKAGEPLLPWHEPWKERTLSRLLKNVSESPKAVRRKYFMRWMGRSMAKMAFGSTSQV